MNNNKQSFVKKSIIVGILICLLGSAGYYYKSTYYPSISEFDKARDKQQLLNIFHQNWHWLFFGKNYSPEFILNYLAPSNDAQYFGKLKIGVLRKGSDALGFVAYYMKTADVGQLLFLAVDSKYRRQRYGDRLFKYGVDQLQRMGAKKIQLLTRLSNIPAQTLYKRFGFYETSRNEDRDVIYFELDPAKSGEKA